jgi:Methyltransferase domain
MNTLDQPSVTFRPATFLSGAPGPWAGHLPFACDLIAALRPEVIVELGVFYGDSYFGFCQTVAETNLPCTCYGVDTWRGDAPASFYESSVYDAVSRHNDRYCRAFSYLMRTPFDDAIKQFSDQSIGLLHMDGSHSYEAAEHDFQNWFPKVRNGGVVLLHDIAVRSGDYGVWRLWEELQKKFPTFEFRNNDGLGVLWKPEGSDEKNPYLQEVFFSSKDNQERLRRYYCLCAERLEMEHTLGLSRASDAGHALLQVVCARSGRYKPEERLTQIIEPGKWTNSFIRLPDGIGDRAMRIDPASRTGIIDISSIVLRKMGGKTVWSWNSAESSEEFRVEGTAYRMPSSDSLRILSFGNAPQIFLPELPNVPANEPLELEIRLRIDIELSAVQDVAQKAADLERARAEWEAAKQDTSKLSDKDRAKQGGQFAEREQDLLRKHEAAKLTLTQAHEEKMRTLIQQSDDKIKNLTQQAEQVKQALIKQHEQMKQTLVKQSEDARQALLKEQEGAKQAIVQQFETARLALEQKVAQAEEQLEQQRRAQASAAADKERLLATHSLLTQEVSIARGNADELRAEIERLTTIQAQTQGDLIDARKVNSRLAAALDQERLARAVMENSRAWQMTKPFRNMFGMFKSSADR